MRLKCLPLLLVITAAAALVKADSFNSEEDGLKPSLSCILWGDVGCRRKCALLCTAFGCLSSNPQCNTVFCDCREKLPIKCLGVIPNAANSVDLPPDVTFKQLLVVKFMRTPVFRDLDKVMPTVPELELEVKKFLYTTDLSGRDLKQEMKRRFPSLKYLFRRLRPRPLAQLNPDVSAEVMKEGINMEPEEEPPTLSYFSSWLKPKPKPKKIDVNSPENQKRIVNLIKKLPYKHDIVETFEALRDSPEKPLYQNICRYFLKEGMLAPDGTQIIKPTNNPAELEKNVQNDDVIRQLEDRINESNEQKKNRKRKRVSSSGENSSEEIDSKKPKLDQTSEQSPNNGWWSPPSLWDSGGNPQNNSGPGQNPAAGPTATDKPSGGWWWGWGSGKSAPPDGIPPPNTAMGPPLQSTGQSLNQGPNSGGSWKWPSWKWPNGSGPQGANMSNPDQSSVQSGPFIGSPWGNDAPIETPVTSSNSGRSLDSPEAGNQFPKTAPPKKTPKERKRKKLQKTPKTKDLQQDVFPDMDSIDKTLGKPKKKRHKHGKHKKQKKHHSESSESNSDESSSEEVSPSGTQIKHKKKKKHPKKSPNSGDSSSEEISPAGGTPTKHKKKKKHHKKPDSDESSSEEIASPGTPIKLKKKKHRKRPSYSDESSSEEMSPQNTPSKHQKKKKHPNKPDSDGSPTKVISPPGSLSEPKKKKKHHKKPSDSDESSSEETKPPGSQPEHKAKKKHRKPKNNDDNLKSLVIPEDYLKPEKRKKNSDSDENDGDENTVKEIPTIGGSSDQRPNGKMNKREKKKKEPSKVDSDESSSEEILPDSSVIKLKKKTKKNEPSIVSSQSKPPSSNDKNSDESSSEKILPDETKTKHHKKNKKSIPSVPSNISDVDNSAIEAALSSNPGKSPKKKNVSASSSASINSSQSPDVPPNDSEQFKIPKKIPDATPTQEMLAPGNATSEKSKGSRSSPIGGSVTPKDLNFGNIRSMNPKDLASSLPTKSPESAFPITKDLPSSSLPKSMLPVEDVPGQHFVPGIKPGDSFSLDDITAGPITRDILEKSPSLNSTDEYGNPISEKVNGPLQQLLKNMPNSTSTPMTLLGKPGDVSNPDIHDNLIPGNADGSIQQILKNKPNVLSSPMTQEGNPRDILNPDGNDMHGDLIPGQSNSLTSKLLDNMSNMMPIPINPSDKPSNKSNPSTRDIQGNPVPGGMNGPLQKLLKNEPNSMLPPMAQISSGKSPNTATIIDSNPLKDDDGLLVNLKFPTSDLSEYPADITLPKDQLSPETPADIISLKDQLSPETPADIISLKDQLSPKNLSPEELNKLTAPSASDMVAKPPSSMFSSLGSLWPSPSQLVNGSPDLNHMDNSSPLPLNNVKSPSSSPSPNFATPASGNPSIPGGLIPKELSNSLSQDGVKPSSPISTPNKSSDLPSTPDELMKTSALDSPLPNSELSQLLDKENPLVIAPKNPDGSPVKGSGNSDTKTSSPINSPNQLLDAQNGLVTGPNDVVNSSPMDKIPPSVKQTPLPDALVSFPNSPSEKKTMPDSNPTAPVNMLTKLLNKQNSTPDDVMKNLGPDIKSSASKSTSATGDPSLPILKDNVEKSPYLPGTPDHPLHQNSHLDSTVVATPSQSPILHKGGREIADHLSEDVPQSLKQINDLVAPLNNSQLADLPSLPSSEGNVSIPGNNLIASDPNETASTVENTPFKLNSASGLSPKDNSLSMKQPNGSSISPSAINSSNPNAIQSEDPSTSSLEDLLKKKLNETKPLESALSDPLKSKSDPSVPDVSSLPNMLLAQKLLNQDSSPGSVPSDEKLTELVDKLKSGKYPSTGPSNSSISNPSNGTLDPTKQPVNDEYLNALVNHLKAENPVVELPEPSTKDGVVPSLKSINNGPSIPDTATLAPDDKYLEDLVNQLKSDDPSLHPQTDPSTKDRVVSSLKSINNGPSIPDTATLAPDDKYLEDLVNQLKSDDPSLHPQSLLNNDPSIITSGPTVEPSDIILQGLVDKLKSDNVSLPTLQSPSTNGTDGLPLPNASNKIVGGDSNGDPSKLPGNSSLLLTGQLGNLNPKSDLNDLPNLSDEDSLAQNSLPSTILPNTLLSSELGSSSNFLGSPKASDPLLKPNTISSDSMPNMTQIQGNRNPSSSSPLGVSPQKIINSMTDNGTQSGLPNNSSPTSASLMSTKSLGPDSPISTNLSNVDNTPTGTTPVMNNLPEKLVNLNNSPLTEDLKNSLPETIISAPPSVGVFMPIKGTPRPDNSAMPSQLLPNENISPLTILNDSNSPIPLKDNNNPNMDALINVSSNVALPSDGSLVVPQTNPNSMPVVSGLLSRTAENNQNSPAGSILGNTLAIGNQPEANKSGEHDDLPDRKKDELKSSLKQMPLSSLSPILMPTDGNPFEALLSKPENPSVSTPSNNTKLPNDNSAKSIDGIKPPPGLSQTDNSLPLLNAGRSMDDGNLSPSDHLINGKSTPSIDDSVPHGSSPFRNPVAGGLGSPYVNSTPPPLESNPKFASLFNKLKNADLKPQHSSFNSLPQTTKADAVSFSPSKDQLMPTNVKPSISNDVLMPAPRSSPVTITPSFADSLSPDNNVKSLSSTPLGNPLNNLPNLPMNVQDSTVPQPSTLNHNFIASQPPVNTLDSALPPGSKNVPPSNQPNVTEDGISPTLMSKTPSTSNSSPIPSGNLLPSLNNDKLDSKQPIIKPGPNVIPLQTKLSNGVPNPQSSNLPGSKPIQGTNPSPLPTVAPSLQQPSHVFSPSQNQPSAATPKVGPEILPKAAPQDLKSNAIPNDHILNSSLDATPKVGPEILPKAAPQDLKSNAIPNDHILNSPLDATPSSSTIPQSVDNFNPSASSPLKNGIIKNQPMTGAPNVVLPNQSTAQPNKISDLSPDVLNSIPSNNLLLPLSPTAKQTLPTASTPSIGNIPSLGNTSVGKSKDDSPTLLNQVPSDNLLVPPSPVAKQTLPSGSTPSIRNIPSLDQTSAGKSKDGSSTPSNQIPSDNPLLRLSPVTKPVLPTGSTPSIENIPSLDQTLAGKSGSGVSNPSNVPNPITITPVHPDSINNPSALPNPAATVTNQQLPNPTSATQKSSSSPTALPSSSSSPQSKPVQSGTTQPPSLLLNPTHSALTPPHSLSPFDELDDSISWSDDEIDISDDSMEFLHNRPKPAFNSPSKSASNSLPKQNPLDKNGPSTSVPPLPLQAPNLSPASPPTPKDLNSINDSPKTSGLPSIITPDGHPASLQNPNTPLSSAPSSLNNPKMNSPSNLSGSPLSPAPISDTLAPSLVSPPPKPLINPNKLFTSEELPDDLHSDEHLNHNNANFPQQPSATPTPSVPSPVITSPPAFKKPNFNSLFTSEELPDELHSEEHPDNHDLKPPPSSLISPASLPSSPPSPLSTPALLPSSPITTSPAGFKKPSIDLKKLFTSEELPADLVSEEHHNPNCPAILPSPPTPQQITPPSPLFTKPFDNNNIIKPPSSPLITPPVNNNINKPSIFASFDDLPPTPPPSFNAFKSPMLTPPMANFDIPITLPKSAPNPSQSSPGTDDESNRKNGGQNWRQKLFQKKAFQPRELN